MSSPSSISWSASTIGVVQSGREVAHGQLGGGELLHRVGRRSIAACRGHRVRRRVTEAVKHPVSRPGSPRANIPGAERFGVGNRPTRRMIDSGTVAQGVVLHGAKDGP